MGSMQVANTNAKQGNIRAIVYNVDGTIKADLGMVSYWHRNPVIRFIGGNIVKFLSDRRIRRYNKEHQCLSPLPRQE